MISETDDHLKHLGKFLKSGHKTFFNVPEDFLDQLIVIKKRRKMASNIYALSDH